MVESGVLSSKNEEGRENVNKERWEDRKVHGRDEVLREVERRARVYSDRVVEDLRNVMNDYEVDIYRIIIAVGRRYGMDAAYEIMSDTVAEKRLKWLDQAEDLFSQEKSELDKGLALFVKYFQPRETDFELVERSERRVVFRRKEFVTAISHACKVLGLDLIDVNNKVYARATNLMFGKVNLRLRHVVLNYSQGWYEEMIEIA